MLRCSLTVAGTATVKMCELGGKERKMEVVKTIQAVRKLVKAAHGEGKKIGFVPTMGALHIGHISLIEAAAKQTDFVVVSIFVNPTQFEPGSDFEKYPRPFDKDLRFARTQV